MNNRDDMADFMRPITEALSRLEQGIADLQERSSRLEQDFQDFRSPPVTSSQRKSYYRAVAGTHSVSGATLVRTRSL
jgi:hypothetical protein